MPKNHPRDRHEKKIDCSHCDKFFPTNDTLIHHLYSEIGVTAQLAICKNQNNEEHIIYEDTNQGPEQCPAEQNVHQNNFMVSETSDLFEDQTESHNLPNNDEMKAQKAIGSQKPIIVKKRNIFSIITTHRAAAALKSPEKVRSLSDKTTKTQEENEYGKEKNMNYEDPEQCSTEKDVHHHQPHQKDVDHNNFTVSETSEHDNITLISKVYLQSLNNLGEHALINDTIKQPTILEDRTRMKAKKPIDSQKPLNNQNKQNIVSNITTRRAAAALKSPEKVRSLSQKTTKTQEENEYEIKYKCSLCGEDFKTKYAAYVHKTDKHPHKGDGKPKKRYKVIFQYKILKKTAIQENIQQNIHDDDDDVAVPPQDDVTISPHDDIDDIPPQIVSESGYSQPEPNDAALQAPEKKGTTKNQDKNDYEMRYKCRLCGEDFKRKNDAYRHKHPGRPKLRRGKLNLGYYFFKYTVLKNRDIQKNNKQNEHDDDLTIPLQNSQGDILPQIVSESDNSQPQLKVRLSSNMSTFDRPNGYRDKHQEDTTKTRQDEVKRTELENINDSEVIKNKKTEEQTKRKKSTNEIECISIPSSPIDECFDTDEIDENYSLAHSDVTQIRNKIKRKSEASYSNIDKKRTKVRSNDVHKTDKHSHIKLNEHDDDINIPPQDDILPQIITETGNSETRPKIMSNNTVDRANGHLDEQQEDTTKTRQDEVRSAEIQNTLDSELTKYKESGEEIKREESTDDIECISIPSSPLDDCFDTYESYKNDSLASIFVTQTTSIKEGKRKGKAKNSNIDKIGTKARSNDVYSTDDDVNDDGASKTTIKRNSRKQKTKKIKQKDSDSSQLGSSDTDADDIIREIACFLKKRKRNSLKRLLQMSKHKNDKLKINRKKKIYKCKKCSTHFMNERKLRKHKQKHNDKKKRCTVCKLKFSKKSIKKHVKKHHMKMNLRLKDFDVITELSSSESSDTESSTTSSDDTDDNTCSLSESQDSEPSTSNENHTEQVENYVKAKKIFTTAENDQDILISRGPKATCLPLLVKTDENTEDNSEPSTSNENHTEQVENYVKAKNLFTTTETDQDILISRGPIATCLPLLVKTDESTEDNSEPSTSNENHTEQVENYVKAKNLFTTAENDQDTLISCGPKATCLPLLIQTDENTKDNSKPSTTNEKHTEQVENYVKAKNLFTTTENDQDILISRGPQATCLPLLVKTDENTEHNSEVTKSIELYKCEICNIYFIRYDTWRKHLSTGDHTIKTKTQCPKCDLNFTKCSLKKHICLHHKKNKNSIKFKIISGSNKLSYINPQITLEQVDLKKIKQNKTQYDIASGIPKTILQTKNKNEVFKKVPRLALERQKQQEKNTNQPKIKYASRLSKTISKKPNLRSISYGKTIYQCRICKVCFLTLATILSHLHTKRHDMSAVKSCSICHLSFYDRVMDRHFQFHHKTLKLRDSSDFQVKILPKFIKNIQNLKEKSANNCPEEKVVYSTRKNTHNAFEENRNHTIQEDKEDERKKQIYSSFIKRQSQKQNELELKCTQQMVKKQLENNIQKTPPDTNLVDERLYKCLQCDVHYFKEQSLILHMARGRHDIKECRPCPICHYTFSDTFLERHISLQHLKLKIEKFTIVNSVKGDESIQESNPSNLVNNLKYMQLKECVVVLTDSQSALVSSTSNDALKFEPQPQVDSENVMEFSDENGKQDVDIHRDTSISEKLNNKISASDIGHDIQLSNIDSQPENINAANMDIEVEIKELDETEMESYNTYFRNSVIVPNSVSSVKILSNVLVQRPLNIEQPPNGQNISALTNPQENIINDSDIDNIDSTILETSYTNNNIPNKLSNTALTKAYDESDTIENATQIEQESYITSETQNSVQETARDKIAKVFATIKHAKPELNSDDSWSSDSTILQSTSDSEYKINSEESTSSSDSDISDKERKRKTKKKKNSLLNKYMLGNTKSLENTPSCSKNNILISDMMNRSEKQNGYENVDANITSTTDIEDQPKKCGVKKVKKKIQQEKNQKNIDGQTIVDVNSLTNPETKKKLKKSFTQKSVHTLNSLDERRKKPVSPKLFEDLVDDLEDEDKVEVVDIYKYCGICIDISCKHKDTY